MMRAIKNKEESLNIELKKLLREKGVILNSFDVKHYVNMIMRDNGKYALRREKLMADFKPNDAVICKIIEMNDDLYKRFRMVYDDVRKMKKKFDVGYKKSSYNSGDKE